MKFHRITRRLPAGVTVRLNNESSLDLAGDFIDDVFKAFRKKASVTHESNTPITLTLDVPENLAGETAAELRAMADELEGRKP